MDGLHAAGLIKTIAIEGRDPGKNISSGLAVQATDKGFITPDTVLCEGIDRLKSHGKIKFEPFFGAATLTRFSCHFHPHFNQNN